MTLTKEDLLAISQVFGEQIKPLKEAIDRLEVRMTRLEERMTALEERVTRLEERVTLLEERMTALEERVGRLEERMTALEERVGQLEERMTALEERVTQLEETVRKLDTRVTALEEKVERLDTCVITLERKTQKMELLMENDMLPRLQNIEGCYLSTYKRYLHGSDQIETMQTDIDMLKKVVGENDTIEIVSISGLVTEYMRQNDIKVLARGIRDSEDLYYELKMARMNKLLYPEMDTIFLHTSENYAYVSSSLIKEILKFNGPINGLVPEILVDEIKSKFMKN